ncbi:hypothetical protein DFJ63DRAFT_310565 [Scheffersomyces coipomensis]|uniref:uncharacterized protein n=1 Tax=Scheffersomyces coipomensis TaxID=1788519 RepID=UPI00315CF951
MNINLFFFNYLQSSYPNLYTRLKMQFSSILSVAAFTTLAAAAVSNTTLTETEWSTTLLTITSCEEVSVCTEKVVSATKVVTTTTVHGVETVYTTICEITEEASKTPAPVAPTSKAPAPAPAPAPTSQAPAPAPAPTTVAPKPAVTTTVDIYSTLRKNATSVPVYEGAGNNVKAGMFLLALAPLAGLI